jgi:asparagine synthase (glutamine-hydrolysing)
MCGISGIYNYHPTAIHADRDELRRIRDDMARRGPDAQGEWFSPDGRIALAHRRLSIIDLSERGAQPMISEDGHWVISFNGEIYNYHALQTNLEQAGFSFHSDSDTEVLLKLYIHKGEAMFADLRGMFAFALWDERKQGLFLARDPYGIKPLYYANNGRCFVFASQVQPMVAHLEVDRSADPAGVAGLMLWGSVPEPYTIYRGIRALPAGHSMWVTAQGATPPRRFASVTEVWKAAAQSPLALPAAELGERVRNALADSVRAHQVADVPVGAFLSAGIDSGALVGLMAEGRASEVQTFTLGFESFRGTGQDETVLAEQIAHQYRTRHQTLWISDEQAEADWPAALAAMDQPSIDGFNTWLVSKHTAAQGLKVVVSGVGGDELFGGYRHFSELPVWQRRLQALSQMPGALAALDLGAGLAQRCGLVHAKARALARLGPNLAGLYLVRRGLFMPWELPQVLDADLAREGLATLQTESSLAEVIAGFADHSYAAIAALEAAFYLRHQLLRDSDWASMAHSLELRTPLADYPLLQTLAPLLANRPPALAGKRVLARAPRPALPETVIDRPKSGFALPMDRWLQKSQVLTQWRANRVLKQGPVPWARRMAYSLIAQAHPPAVVR